MLKGRICSCFASVLVCLGMAGADPGAQDAVRMRVVALGNQGVVGDLAVADWTVRVGGSDAKVLSQRAPAETEKEGQKWAFVLLPIRGPEYREMALHAIATFMTTLPPSDSVLVVLRTANGLVCLTPGFTVRPSLWAKALDVARAELGARLPGNAAPVFTLPANPGETGEDSMEPIQAFLGRLAAKRLDKRADDVTGFRAKVTDIYAPGDLAGYSIAIGLTLKSLEALGAALVQEPGVKHTVVFSRNEIDDLVNPIWSRLNAQANGAVPVYRSPGSSLVDDDSTSSRLKSESMVRDVTLAHQGYKERMLELGLEVHGVGVASGAYNGAFAEVAYATGGQLFGFGKDLTAKLCTFLPLWASGYELQVAVPANVPHPAKVAVLSTRKDVKLFVPSSR